VAIYILLILIKLKFLIYKPDGHYNPHVDTFHTHSNETRKLTALAFLNDDYEGGKFFLNANGTLYYPPWC
jgi:Rps23 Pro-64 3,4-dihydroxylase Tpa1-like proline 4-hydroxylase